MCGKPTAVGGGVCGVIAVLTDFGRLLSRVATAHLTFLVEGTERHDTVIATATAGGCHAILRSCTPCRRRRRRIRSDQKNRRYARKTQERLRPGLQRQRRGE